MADRPDIKDASKAAKALTELIATGFASIKAWVDFLKTKTGRYVLLGVAVLVACVLGFIALLVYAFMSSILGGAADGAGSQSACTVPTANTVDSSVLYSDLINQYAASNNLPAALVAGVIFRESSFNPNASSGLADGLMQITPDNATRLGVTDPFDPEQNIKAGTSILAGYLNTFNGDVTEALEAYNWGPANVQAGGSVPTQVASYAEDVLASAQTYNGGAPIPMLLPGFTTPVTVIGTHVVTIQSSAPDPLSACTGPGSLGGLFNPPFTLTPNPAITSWEYNTGTPVNGLLVTTFPDGLTITSPYGVPRSIAGASAYNDADDIDVADGTPIFAVASGVVTSIADDCPDVPNNASCGGAGNYVIVTSTADDGSTYWVRYAHLSTVAVTQGQGINASDPIGDSGQSGAATGPHLQLLVCQNHQTREVAPLIDPRIPDSPWVANVTVC